MKKITGSICAPKGFKASGVHCGIRNKQGKKDLALIVSDVRASCACVYTQNLVKGAPIYVTQKNVADGMAQAIIVNSGNANTCNANGIEIAEQMCALTAERAGIAYGDVVVASTGVIGQPLSIEPIAGGMTGLVAGLSTDPEAATEAIMTTDVMKKETAYEFELSGITCRIGGIAKGSGMIHPNMATMLAFITTDVAITAEMLQKALSDDVQDTFNMVSVDGDTSTNDMATVLANGMAGNKCISEESADYNTFRAALRAVTSYLSRCIAKDGEGATKLLECVVSGASDTAAAKAIAKSVIRSPLVKSAMFGSDANWGRILCAAGYAGVETDLTKARVGFRSCTGYLYVCENGYGVEFSEAKAKTVLSADEIRIEIDLSDGGSTATAWGCDLTYDYVKINGDYRT